MDHLIQKCPSRHQCHLPIGSIHLALGYDIGDWSLDGIPELRVELTLIPPPRSRREHAKSRAARKVEILRKSYIILAGLITESEQRAKAGDFRSVADDFPFQQVRKSRTESDEVCFYFWEFRFTNFFTNQEEIGFPISARYKIPSACR